MRGYYPGEREYREKRSRGPRFELPRVELPRFERRRRTPRERARRARTRTRASHDHPRSDWAIGIALGIVLGLAVISAFLFFGSEDTIDAPSIKGVDTGRPPAREAPATPGPE